METIKTIEAVRAKITAERFQGKTIGFVPTMGFLHEGHISLITAAKEMCDIVVVSIFVNPLQFTATEDLATYPKDIETDALKASNAGCHYLFTPSVSQMYPSIDTQLKTSVEVPALSRLWEGASRPGHFEGVATVVNKLLNIIGPCKAFFGKKDFQQLAVIKQMVTDLSIPSEIISCPTVRETTGLAMSSRNTYLDKAQKQDAAILYKTLKAAKELIESGETNPKAVEEFCIKQISEIDDATVDYVAVVDPETLEIPIEINKEVRILAAIKIANVRLLDNIGCNP